MTNSDNYILVDYKKLAYQMASHQFHWEYEEDKNWDELYEQVDDSGNWYLKTPYDSVFDALQEEWESMLLDFDIINSI